MSQHIQELRNRLTGEPVVPIERNPESVQNQRDYWKQVFESTPKGSPPFTLKLSIEPYDKAMQRFRDIWRKSVEDERIKRDDPSFNVKLNEQQIETIRGLVAYFSGNKSQFDLKKGLYIYGNVGSGKSMLMKCLFEFAYLTDYEFSLTNFQIEMSQIKEDVNRPYLHTLVSNNRCFDEVGFGTSKVQRYTNKVDVFEEVMYARHIRFDKYRQKTFVVSNLPPSLFAEDLDPRMADRIAAMMQEVPYFSDESYR